MWVSRFMPQTEAMVKGRVENNTYSIWIMIAAMVFAIPMLALGLVSNKAAGFSYTYNCPVPAGDNTGMVLNSPAVGFAALTGSAIIVGGVALRRALTLHSPGAYAVWRLMHYVWVFGCVVATALLYARTNASLDRYWELASIGDTAAYAARCKEKLSCECSPPGTWIGLAVIGGLVQVLSMLEIIRILDSALMWRPACCGAPPQDPQERARFLDHAFPVGGPAAGQANGGQRLSRRQRKRLRRQQDQPHPIQPVQPALDARRAARRANAVDGPLTLVVRELRDVRGWRHLSVPERTVGAIRTTIAEEWGVAMGSKEKISLVWDQADEGGQLVSLVNNKVVRQLQDGAQIIWYLGKQAYLRKALAGNHVRIPIDSTSDAAASHAAAAEGSEEPAETNDEPPSYDQLLNAASERGGPHLW